MTRPSYPPASSGEPRRARDATATRQRLLDAAEHEFAARGFAGARLREIADGAGVQPALIHHYFTDKEGLYRAVIDRGLLETSTESWSLLGRRQDLEGLLSGFVELLVTFYAQHQYLLAILRHEALSGGPVLVELARERTLPIVEAVAALLEQMQRSGEVRDDVTPGELILAALSMVVYPSIDAGMLAVLLPETARTDAASLDRRKRAIVAMLMSAYRR